MPSPPLKPGETILIVDDHPAARQSSGMSQRRLPEDTALTADSERDPLRVRKRVVSVPRNSPLPTESFGGCWRG